MTRSGITTPAISLLCLVVLSSCARHPEAEPTPRANALVPQAYEVVQQAHKDPRWQAALETLVRARNYYAVKRTWGNPALQSEEDRMADDLRDAVAGIRSLQEEGVLTTAEAELMAIDLNDETWAKYHRSRNVRDGATETHMDGTFPDPFARAYDNTVKRLPYLRSLAATRGRNPHIIAAAAATAGDAVRALAKSPDKLPPWSALLRAIAEPNKHAPVPVSELVDEAEKLLAQIRRNTPSPPQ